MCVCNLIFVHLACGTYTYEDLLELNISLNYDKTQDEESKKPDEKVLTLKGLSKAFQLIKGLQIIGNEDTNRERFSKIEWNVLNSLACYEEFYQ